RPAGPCRQAPRPAVRRPAAARSHCPRAGHGPGGDAVRRADVGPRPGDGQRSAGCHGAAGPRGHDHDVRHPRDGLCPQGRRPGNFHGRRADRRRLCQGRLLRRGRGSLGSRPALPLQDPAALMQRHADGRLLVPGAAERARIATGSAHADPQRARFARRAIRAVFRHLVLLTLPLLVFGGGYGGYLLSKHTGIRALAENGERQLELNARAVESEITKYTYLPSLLELESDVERLLLDPSPQRRQRVNDYLEGLNRRSGSLATYILDTSGRVLATSNWRSADSYQGEDLSFRAYFQDAVQGRPGRFYGIGSTTGEPGYYLAH